jgi:hypothetical protein
VDGHRGSIGVLSSGDAGAGATGRQLSEILQITLPPFFIPLFEGRGFYEKIPFKGNALLT